MLPIQVAARSTGLGLSLGTFEWFSPRISYLSLLRGELACFPFRHLPSLARAAGSVPDRGARPHSTPPLLSVRGTPATCLLCPQSRAAGRAGDGDQRREVPARSPAFPLKMSAQGNACFLKTCCRGSLY